MRFNLLAAVMLCIVSSAMAQPYHDEWTMEKSFKLKPTTEVEINNKYGMFQVHEWNKDSLKVVIQVSISERSADKLDKVRNGIDFSFVENMHYVVVETKLTAVTFLDDIKHSLMNDDKPVEINYDVYLPATTKIKLINKYGDIFMGNHSGEVSVELSYGKFKAYELKSYAKIDLSFADASIAKMTDGMINLDYSEFECDEAGVLQVESKSSQFNVGTATEMQLNSKRDKINVQKLSILNFTSSYSDAKFNDVRSDASLSVKYGDVDVWTSNPAFVRFQLASKYADVVLGFNGSAINYDIDLTCKNVRLTYPRSLSHLKEDLSEVSDKIYHYRGWMGSRKSGVSAVTVNAEYGSILLMHK